MSTRVGSDARGTDPHSLRDPRRAHRTLQDAREKLTYRYGTRPEFDHELLTMFVRNELGATLTIPLVAVIVALGAMFWSPNTHPLMWLAVVFVAKGIELAMCRKFMREPPATSNVARWRHKLAAAEFFYGVSWASIAFVDVSSQNQSVLMFIFASMIVVISMRMAFASTVLSILYAGTVPMTAAIVLRFALLHDPFYWAMATMAVGVHIYFVFLIKGMHQTVYNMLEYRAEKDALIAELEQSKSVSDEARRRAEAANISKSRFLATMSHELRTPLNAILGFSEVMQAEIMGPHTNPTYRDYARDIHTSGQHLLNLINEILDLSRIEAGRYELKQGPLELADVVEDCHRLLKLRAQNKGLRIVEEFTEGMPQIWGDERAMRQICLNILSNAIKFTPSGGQITLTVAPAEGGGQKLAIKDTGPGIPEHEIPRVLTSFGQGSLAHQTAEGGTGLGLPIVRGLVELHDGTFELRSKLRYGTEVIVTFPPKRIMEAMPRLAEPGEETEAAPSPRSPRPPLRRRSA